MARLIEKHSKTEEFLHSLTHGSSAILGAVGLAFLISRSAPLGALDLAGAIIFGVSLILLYSASAIYHSAPFESRARDVLQKFDHCMIFVLILGTYVPVCWTALGGWLGWCVFGVVAACSVIGIIVNLIDIARFHKFSLLLYVISGWMIAIATVPFIRVVGWEGFAFLLAGGISYTVGIYFYRIHRIPYMHLIWHLLVSLGSALHFIMIYSYVY